MHAPTRATTTAACSRPPACPPWPCTAGGALAMAAANRGAATVATGVAAGACGERPVAGPACAAAAAMCGSGRTGLAGFFVVVVPERSCSAPVVFFVGAAAIILSSWTSRCAAGAGSAGSGEGAGPVSSSAAGTGAVGVETTRCPVAGSCSVAFCVLTLAMMRCVATTASRQEPSSSERRSPRQGKMPRSRPSHHLPMAS
mmetsp:Transcript_129958/g.404225  ORF Transcript_129958/g.404225 Transcript_129958/m.404225 type:complete len:200 (+) Transcript_129958:140-739(+)